MHDHTLAGLAEDVLRHGMPEKAADVGLVQTTGLGNLSEGCLGVHGEAGGYLEAADSLHADQLVMLAGMVSACPGWKTGPLEIGVAQ